MERNESISELLLSRLPQSTNLAAYQKEVTSLLAENEKKLRRTLRFAPPLSLDFLGQVRASQHINATTGAKVQNDFAGLQLCKCCGVSTSQRVAREACQSRW